MRGSRQVPEGELEVAAARAVRDRPQTTPARPWIAAATNGALSIPRPASPGRRHRPRPSRQGRGRLPDSAMAREGGGQVASAFSFHAQLGRYPAGRNAQLVARDQVGGRNRLRKGACECDPHCGHSHPPSVCSPYSRRAQTSSSGNVSKKSVSVSIPSMPSSCPDPRLTNNSRRRLRSRNGKKEPDPGMGDGSGRVRHVPGGTGTPGDRASHGTESRMTNSVLSRHPSTCRMLGRRRRRSGKDYLLKGGVGSNVCCSSPQNPSTTSLNASGFLLAAK